MLSPSEEPVPRTIIDIKLVTTLFVNEFHLGEPCNGTRAPYLMFRSVTFQLAFHFTSLLPSMRYSEFFS